MPKYLTSSMVSSYDDCPAAYKFWYIDRLRPNQRKAVLEFGSVIHKGVEALFAGAERPEMFFLAAWEVIKGDENFKYAQYWNWEKFRDIGLKMFPLLSEGVGKRNVRVIAHPEKKLRVVFTKPPIVLQGWLDVIVEMDIPVEDLGYAHPDAKQAITGAIVVPDVKTSAGSYDPGLVFVDEQLTFYALLAEQSLGLSVDYVGFIVLVKTKEPRVEWHYAKRTEEDFKELAWKAYRTNSRIESGEFPKRSFKTFSCPSFCDFYPLCVRGDAAMGQFHVEPWPEKEGEVK